ncbi:hypothetical protein Nmel_003995, partial [Mimus melanotis]
MYESAEMARRERRRDCRRGSDWSPGPASPLPTRLAWGRHADAGGGGSGSASELHFLWGRGGRRILSRRCACGFPWSQDHRQQGEGRPGRPVSLRGWWVPGTARSRHR